MFCLRLVLSSRVTALTLASVLACSPTADGAVAVTGQSAPPWQLQDVHGRTVRLSDYAGKVVLLNFFRTTCVPCLWEMPDFVALHTQYGSQGLVVIGIAVQQTADTLLPFIQAQGISYPVCLSNDEVLWDYNVFPLGAIPLTTVIDRGGLVADWYRHYHAKSYHEQIIQPLLAAPAPPTTPALSFALSAGSLSLAWPTNASDFILETKDSYTQHASWQTATASVRIVAGHYRVTLPATRPSGFFRLRQP